MTRAWISASGEQVSRRGEEYLEEEIVGWISETISLFITYFI